MTYGVPVMGGEVAAADQTRAASTTTVEPAAEPATTTSQAELDAQVRDRYLVGARALDAGRHEEAYRVLLEAWRMKQLPLIAANLGIAELQLGRHRDAAEHLAYFLRDATGVGSEGIRQAEWMLREAQKHIGTVKVEVNQPEAEILVDGQPVGTAPLGRELFLEPGQRVIEARRAGFTPAQVALDVAAGSTRPVSLKLESLPAPVPERAERPAPKDETVVWPAAVAAGLALGNLGLGVGFTIAANDRSEAAEEVRRSMGYGGAACRAGASSPACARVGALLEERDRFSNLAAVGYAAGGLAAVGAAALAIWPLRYTVQGSEARLTPMASLQGGGLVMKGTF